MRSRFFESSASSMKFFAASVSFPSRLLLIYSRSFSLISSATWSRSSLSFRNANPAVRASLLRSLADTMALVELVMLGTGDGSRVLVLGGIPRYVSFASFFAASCSRSSLFCCSRSDSPFLEMRPDLVA